MNPKKLSPAGPARRAGRPWRPRCWPLTAGICLLFLVFCWVSSPLSAKEPEAQYSVPARLAPQSLLLDAVAVKGGIWAVGERGHVLFTADSGRTWRQAQVPTRETLTGVTFHGDRLGWAVGHREVILRTTDGGQSWQKVHQPTEACSALLDVWFQDDRNGFAIGAYGLCLRTRDGGTSWEAVRVSDEDWHLHHMAQSSDGRLFIAAEAGQIHRSDDGGETWTTLKSPYNGSFFGVLPLKQDALLVFGLRGHVFRSPDAGNTWDPVPTGTVATLADGLFLSDGRILLSGLAGTLLVGPAEGMSFTQVPGPGRRGIWSVIQVSEQSVICFGEGGATRVDLVK